MKIEVQGNLPREYFWSVVRMLKKRVKVPRHAEFYFLKDQTVCVKIVTTLHQHAKASFKNLCESGNTTFSYGHGRRRLVIVQVKERKYLLKNKQALLGLLLHEVVHLNQKNTKIERRMKLAYRETFEKNRRLLMKLKYPRKKLQRLYQRLATCSLLLLKDLYVNTWLIQHACSKYLLEYYNEEFHHKKACPSPVFYEKFKKAAQKDLNVVSVAFEFEFSLLSVVLPFQKFHAKEAEELMRTIRKCYELNIQEIARRCHELVSVYEQYFDADDFPKRFLNAVFAKVYLLLL